MQKDIRLARQIAYDLQIPLPSATAADHVLARARNLGYGHRDLAALHEVLANTHANQLLDDCAATRDASNQARHEARAA